MRIIALIGDTLRELTGKVTLLILIGISTLFILGTLAAFSARETPEGILLSLFGKEAAAPVPPDRVEAFVFGIQASLSSGLMTGIVLFGVFATAGLIPSVLDRGIVDLYLSRPLARWELILGKSLGAVTAIVLVSLYFLGAIFLVFGLKVGIWNPQILTAAAGIGLVFITVYVLLLFTAVCTGSTPLSIIAAYVYLFVIAGLLQGRESGLFLFSENNVFRSTIDGLYYLLPQIPAMRQSISEWIMHQPAEWVPFLQSIASAGLFFVGSAAILERKDF